MLKTSAPACISASDGPALRAAFLAAAILAVGPGCIQVRGIGAGGKQPIVDVQIINDARDRGDAAADVSDDALKPTILRMMTGWSDFAFRRARPDEVGWQLTVRLVQLTERTADIAAPAIKARSAAFALELKALGSVQGERSRYAAEKLLTRQEDQTAPIAALVQDTLLAAGARLMRLRSLYKAPPDEAVAALSDDDEVVRLAAIQIVGDREIRDGIPKLIEQLKADGAPGAFVVSTVGALARMQATEATDAIIDTARRQDRTYIVPLLYALAQLGGRKAQAYLFTVQSGHPDPVVKQAAAEALEELERRAQTAPDSAPDGK